VREPPQDAPMATTPRPGDLRQCWRAAVRFGRALVGLHDYEARIAHLRACHPGQPLPTWPEFVAERQRARYRRGGRCC
jgi:uncharacterized short protein YbdD (DUF466 family)